MLRFLLLSFGLLGCQRAFERFNPPDTSQQRAPRLSPNVAVRGLSPLTVSGAEPGRVVTVVIDGSESYEVTTDDAGNGAPFVLAQQGKAGVLDVELRRNGAAPTTQTLLVTSGAATMSSVASLSGEVELVPGEQAQIIGEGFDPRGPAFNLVWFAPAGAAEDSWIPATVLGASAGSLLVRVPAQLRGKQGVPISADAVNAEIRVSPAGDLSLMSAPLQFVLTLTPTLVGTVPGALLGGEEVVAFFAEDPLSIAGRGGIDSLDLTVDRLPLTRLRLADPADFPGRPTGSQTAVVGRVPSDVGDNAALRVAGPRAKTTPRPLTMLAGGDLFSASPSLLNAFTSTEVLFAGVSRGEPEAFVRFVPSSGQLDYVREGRAATVRFASGPVTETAGQSVHQVLAKQIGGSVFAMVSKSTVVDSTSAVSTGATVLPVDSPGPSFSRPAGEVGALAFCVSGATEIPLYVFAQASTVGFLRLDTGEVASTGYSGGGVTRVELAVLDARSVSPSTVDIVVAKNGTLHFFRMNPLGPGGLIDETFSGSEGFVGSEARFGPMAVVSDEASGAPVVVTLLASGVVLPSVLRVRSHTLSLDGTTQAVTGMSSSTTTLSTSESRNLIAAVPFASRGSAAGGSGANAGLLAFLDDGGVAQAVVYDAHGSDISQALNALGTASLVTTSLGANSQVGFLASEFEGTRAIVSLSASTLTRYRVGGGGSSNTAVDGNLRALVLVENSASPLWTVGEDTIERMEDAGLTITEISPSVSENTGVIVVAGDQLRQAAAVAPLWSFAPSGVRELDLALFDAQARTFDGVVHAVLPTGRELVADTLSSSVHGAPLGSAGKHVQADPLGEGFWADVYGARLFYTLAQGLLSAAFEYPASAFGLAPNAVPVVSTVLFDSVTLATAWRTCKGGKWAEALTTYRREANGSLSVNGHLDLGVTNLACTTNGTVGIPIELVAMRDQLAYKRTVDADDSRTTFVAVSEGGALSAPRSDDHAIFPSGDGRNGVCPRQSVALGSDLLQWNLRPAEGSCNVEGGPLSVLSASGVLQRQSIDASLSSAPYSGFVPWPQATVLSSSRASRGLLALNTDGGPASLSLYESEPFVSFVRTIAFGTDEPLAFAPALGGEAALVWTKRGLWFVR